MSPGDSEASIRTVEVLLAAGLGLDAPAFTEGTWRATPLWHVISRGRNLELATHFLERGADPDHCLFAAVWNEDNDAIRLLLRYGANIEEGAERGETPLLGAVAWSKFGPAEELLKAGADPNVRNAEGATALHLMLKKGSAPEHFQLFCPARRAKRHRRCLGTDRRRVAAPQARPGLSRGGGDDVADPLIAGAKSQGP
ncbi:ankyrin repeat domain-containing protein [Sphingomonas psychrotolerans]|uniref:Ankyrin repeat domain-containing protein n=1 Tax=Sphingomonas psychrotolerans TaxID=1327635 RepID=A0ABU3N1D9_9SPHN|nr:ankyrin repeat domain-containing protein [Sphingomonas psychrotolerans]